MDLRALPSSGATSAALAATLLLLLWACGGEVLDERVVGVPESSGRLVIIGGGLQAENTAVYQAILDGRSGEGPVCVFPTASADPQESMESAISRFDAVGGEGTAQGIFLTVDNPSDAALPETVAKIEGCSGFYFVGGQQRRIIEVFRPEERDTPAYEALLARHLAGAVVSGSSAGAAIMTDPMIGGGNSAGAVGSGVRGEGDEEGVVLGKGLGLLKTVFVDQHFLARGRWARLLVAVLATDSFDLGMGIDENTALVVDGDSAWVAGASGVLLFDTREVVRDEGGNAGSGIVLSLLGSGAGVDLRTGEIQVRADKSRLLGTGEAYSASELDLFDRWALLHFLSDFAVSSDTLFTHRQNGHLFEFLKEPGFEAHAWSALGAEDTPFGLSVGPLRLSLIRDSPN